MNTIIVFLVLLIFIILFIPFTTPDIWKPVDEVLETAIFDHAFPGSAAIVGIEEKTLYKKTFGYFTYEKTQPVTFETLWDMASVSKVLTTTSAISQFYERGELKIDTPISYFFPAFATQGKESVTVKNCLLHNAGFYPDPVPNFNTVEFGCPESFKYHPLLSFSCQEKVFNYVMNMPLAPGRKPGEKYVYSDLSMITLMFVVGKLAKDLGYVKYEEISKYTNCPANGEGKGELQCFFESYIKKFIILPLGMNDSGYVTNESDVPKIKKIAPPGWNETDSFRHEVISGYVSDENAYSMGGVAGHAGLFTNLNDLEKIMRAILFQQTPPNVHFLKKSTIEYFSTCYNLTQSSRALGWDTMMDGPGSCGSLSLSTFLHLGYSGTQVCFDKERKLFTALLSNRVYPDKLNTKISKVRKDFNSAVQKIFDSSH